MTIAQLEALFRKKLMEIYHEDEAKAIVSLVLEEVCAIKPNSLNLEKEQPLTPSQIEISQHLLERLLKHEPVQYVLGTAWFYGMKLVVSKDVLIPRPETEELVRIISADNKLTAPSILDIGTGSGCIALGLKRMVPGSIITAIDISDEALSVAQENAAMQNAEIDFRHCDILKWEVNTSWPNEKYDIIVSNPPYISDSEKSSLSENVIAFEPHLALFVPVNDNLLFYRHISFFANKFLKAGGCLYFEINQKKADDIIQLLIDQGFVDVQDMVDLSGNKRFIKALKAGE